MSRTTLYSNPVMALEGWTHHGEDYARLVLPDWAIVLPITKEGSAVLVEQYRHGVQALSLEVPGGIVDPGEDGLQAAQRELLEETGFGGGEWHSLGWVFPNPALQTNRCHLFLARGVELKSEPQLEPQEELSTTLVPAGALSSMVRDGRIAHALHVLAVERCLANALL